MRINLPEVRFWIKLFHTRCPKKKWDLLLLLQVVNPTFFGTPCILQKKKFSEIQDCFDENTFFLNETVYGGTVSNWDIFHDMSKWMIDNSNVNLGQCHTYTHLTPLKTKKISDGIRILLNPNATSYLILLHDPNFYLVYGLPSVFFPSIFKRYYKVERWKGLEVGIR